MQKPYRSRRFTLGGRRSTPVIKIAQMQGNLLELVGNNPESRNWRGIAIALAVILLVIGLVALSVLLLTPDTTLPFVPNVNLTDIVDQKWKIPKESWINGNLVFKDLDGNIVKISSPSNDPQVLISRQTQRDNRIVDYKLSKDGRYALLAYNKIQTYTYSYNASYYVYDINSRTKEQLIHESSESVFQYADFGAKGNSILYALNGDLFYKSNAEVDSPARQLTLSGNSGLYQNGIADWLYEEEILKRTDAIWWSPNGRYLAFASFDDRKVQDNYITLYNKGDAADILTYTKDEKYKYPKAGCDNPVVEIHIIDMETFEQKTWEKPSWNGHELDIFHSLSWIADNELLITWSNRNMTSSLIQQCFPSMKTCMDDVIRQSITSNKIKNDEKGGWLTNLDQVALPSDDPGLFFYILPLDHGGMGGFNHLAMINKTKKPSEPTFLTRGNWEVTKLLYYDSERQYVYYISNERYAETKHVFRVDLNRNRKCITCSLLQSPNGLYVSGSFGVGGQKRGAKIEDGECKYYDATFGTSAEWFVVRCLGPVIPFSGLVQLNSLDKLPNTLRVIRPPEKSLEKIILPTSTFHNIAGANGRKIKVKMLIPASMHVGKRPVVFFKGDLGSQTVDFRYDVDLASYIVKKIGAIVVSVDGRGSGARGNQLLQYAAGNPGIYEIKDMKTVLKFMTNEMEETADTDNVAVVGTGGYGGYVAGLSVTGNEFRCAVAKSPITDWSLYDSFGSEYILGSTSTYSRSYQKHNLVHSIGEITGSQLRIFQGLQDKKVNMQHSVLLKQSAMLSELPLDSLDITFHTSKNQLSENEARAMEFRIYESTSLFLRNCLFGNDEAGRKKLELLENNYGIPS